MKTNMKYSVVIPCYCSSNTIGDVVALTSAQLESDGITDYEFILVNDHSPDDGKTIAALKLLATEHSYVTAVELARNTGQHNALMAGLNFACGDIIICMDDDMQTHPSQLPLLLGALCDDCDVVYGYYPQKKHNFFRNFGSKINYLSVRILIGKPKELKTSSFFVMKKFVRDSIIEYKNSYAYMQGLVLRTTRNIKSIPIQHFERQVGQSGYTFKKLIALWSSIIGFSIVPLRLCTYLGYLTSGLSIIAAIIVLIKKLFFTPQMAMGWPSTVIIICFFFGLVFLFLGLIGEYIGRIFLGLNNQPQYVVKEVYKKED